tara:strand:- start:74 stop:292 length:219 start_codon:yes stop_codon:yes gene_type:complete
LETLLPIEDLTKKRLKEIMESTQTSVTFHVDHVSLGQLVNPDGTPEPCFHIIMEQGHNRAMLNIVVKGKSKH